MSKTQATAEGSAPSDAELIAAVRAGDSEAFAALYERHAVAARSVARQYLPSTDADDVVGEAFIRILDVLRGGGGPDVAFRAYLFTIVRRLCHESRAGTERTAPSADQEAFESALGPLASTEDPALAGLERSMVARAFRSLPERWQAVLWYTEVEEMPPARIAPLLGMTANGVAALAYRAREGLRQSYLHEHLAQTFAADCAETNPLLASYVRNGLSTRERERVEEHLDTCVACSALVLELSSVSSGMRSVVAPLVLGAGAAGLAGRAMPLAGGGAVGAGSVGILASGGAVLGAGAGGGAGAAAGVAAGPGIAGAVLGSAGAGISAAAIGGGGGAVAVGAVAGVASAAMVLGVSPVTVGVTLGVAAVTALGVVGVLGVLGPIVDPSGVVVAPSASSSSAPSPGVSPTDGAEPSPGVSPSALPAPLEPSFAPTEPESVDPAPNSGAVAGADPRRADPAEAVSGPDAEPASTDLDGLPSAPPNGPATRRPTTPPRRSPRP